MAIPNGGGIGRLFYFFLPWLSAIWLIGCGDQASSPQNLVARMFAKQVEFDGSHLIARLPKGKASPIDNALTFKIPKEYLIEKAAHKNWPGIFEDEHGVSTVSIDFSMPDVTEWAPPTYEQSKKMGREGWEHLARKRVLVRIKRDGGSRTEYGGGIDSQYNKAYRRDGMFAGLERYTRTICYQGATLEEPKVQEILRGKPADDGSPENCILWRRSSIFIAPPALWAEGRGVKIECVNGTCGADIAVGGHRAEVTIHYEQLPDWEPRVQAARKLVSSFIVKE